MTDPAMRLILTSTTTSSLVSPPPPIRVRVRFRVRDVLNQSMDGLNEDTTASEYKSVAAACLTLIPWNA